MTASQSLRAEAATRILIKDGPYGTAIQGERLPAETAAQVREWLDSGLVNIVGGCCGTTPEHIAAIAEAARGREPRKVPTARRQTLLAGLEPMVIAA